MILALVSLVIAIGCYSVSQLQQHGKLKWSKDDESFWGWSSDKRKYKPGTKEPKFFLSTTWLVFTTDGYHFAQFMAANFLSVAFTFALGFNWWLLLGVWLLIHVIHATLYHLLQK